jgi:hypothetical protein
MQHTKMKLYRYERDCDDEQITPQSASLRLVEFEVVKETEKGYWIKTTPKNKFCYKATRYNKSYASISPEIALENFIERTKNCIWITKCRIEAAEIYLNIAKNLK